ncbi:MAG: hypothetical protein M3Y87_37525 [Myxococcota bacterium]|nr:hypothetical protein [Myxococcota bacterium]
MQQLVLAVLAGSLVAGCYCSHEREPAPAHADGGHGWDGAADDSGAAHDASIGTPADDLPGPLASVCIGLFHACASTDDGEVHCWGNNGLGQVGDGTLEWREQPVRVEGLPPVRRIRCAHRTNTCAVSESGAVYCWGALGALGPSLSPGTTETLGDAVVRPVRMDRLESGVTDVVMARDFTCALRGAIADCWGEREDGEPYIQRGLEVGAIVHSSPHAPGACELRADGTALFHASISWRLDARVLAEGVRQLTCSDGNAHSEPRTPHYEVCFSTEPGHYRCGDVDGTFAPAPVYDGFQQIAIGTQLACGIHGAGEVACRSMNDWLDAVPSTDEWAMIALPEPAAWIGAAGASVCAVSESGRMWCWGSWPPRYRQPLTEITFR